MELLSSRAGHLKAGCTRKQILEPSVVTHTVEMLQRAVTTPGWRLDDRILRVFLV